ncbi:transposase [Loktanella sp. M215]|nr:transposase [Loktanella sp. M215]
MPSSRPTADWLLGDLGHGADLCREALVDRKITHFIQCRKSRDKIVKYDTRRYWKRSRIDIMCGRLKDRRRVATRCDRDPKVFPSTIALAATVISGYAFRALSASVGGADAISVMA